MSQPALLALEDGALFHGIAFGHHSQTPCFSVGEVVFNTSMTGYEEILTDPSYANQLVTMTYPHIGNVGTNLEDRESNAVLAKGLIIRQLPYRVSNWRAQITLEQFLAQHQVVGIAEIDTRRLTRLIRAKGALRGCIYTAPIIGEQECAQALRQARAWKGLKGLDLAKVFSTKHTYLWEEGGNWDGCEVRKPPCKGNWQVVVYDFGVKKTILRCLDDLDCAVTVVPAQTSAQEVLALSPDGILLSNGPGDPEPCDYAISAIQTFLTHSIPLFGICLGHQLLALACNAKTMKMKCGHHGANHPVRDIKTNQVIITSQNHGFAVEEASLPDCLEVTHRSLFDSTIQGIKHKTLPAFGFQGHPEAGPGPQDGRYLFQDFVVAMQAYRAHRAARFPSTVQLELNE